MSVYNKIRGTSEQLFSLLFGTNRVQLKNNSGALEARNDADSGFVIARGATPVASNDLTTKAYVDGFTAARTTFTANGTFTAPATGLYALYGSGGGGSGAGGPNGGTVATGKPGGGGGGCGEYGVAFVQLNSGQTLTIVIGAGGASVAHDVNGNHGGDTKVTPPGGAALFSWRGGSGGTSGAADTYTTVGQGGAPGYTSKQSVIKNAPGFNAIPGSGGDGGAAAIAPASGIGGCDGTLAMGTNNDPGAAGFGVGGTGAASTASLGGGSGGGAGGIGFFSVGASFTDGGAGGAAGVVTGQNGSPGSSASGNNSGSGGGGGGAGGNGGTTGGTGGTGAAGDAGKLVVIGPL